MAAQGFHKSDFIFYPGVLCKFSPDHHKAKERNIIFKQCREYLIRFVEEHDIDVVIPIGAQAARQVFGRSVKITKVRGIVHDNEDLGVPILPMLDPMIVLRYPQHESTFATDCKTLARFVDADLEVESMAQRYGEYELVDDLQFLIDQRHPIMAFDVETIGFRPHAHDTRLLTMQFCPEPGKAYMVLWDHPEYPTGQRQRAKLRRQLQQLLCREDLSIVGQNLKFDARWLTHETGIVIRQDHDTLIMQSLLDENLQDKSLDMLVKIHVPDMAGYADDFNNRYDKSRMDLVPLEDLVDYGCGDTDATLRLYGVLRPLVERDEKLWAHYRYVDMPGLNAFANVERRGQLIDHEQLDRFEVELSEKVQNDRQALFRRIHRDIKRKHLRHEDKEPLKFTRRDFLRDILFYHPRGCQLAPQVFTKSTEKLSAHEQLASTSTKDHLPYFYEDPEHGQFVMDLAQHLKDIRLLETNVQSFREKYIVDGKIHPVYSLSTAVTGRTASRDPNGQNFPARGPMAKSYKKIFVPPPGHFLLQADLSQAELRISGNMALDPVMLEIYNSGGDIHTNTACIVMGLRLEQFLQLTPEERSLARFKAKAVNFGFIYGMGWRKFIVYAKTQYGVEFTPPEAQRIRNGFFSTYAGLTSWHLAMRAFVNQHGYVRSYSGRIRHLPTIHSDEEWVRQEAERQAINSPVQNFASDLGVMAMARMDLELNSDYLAITQFVHDALYCYVPYRYVEWGAKILKWYMESNPIDEWFGCNLEVPIIADVSFGTSGGDMYEMAGLDIAEPFDFESCLEGVDHIEIPEQDIPPEYGYREVPAYLVVS
jgi:DNA polymerase I-like protein with 3'-5' exonuclease and polymerase domains